MGIQLLQKVFVNVFSKFWCVFLLLKRFTNASGMKMILKTSVQSYSEK